MAVALFVLVVCVGFSQASGQSLPLAFGSLVGGKLRNPLQSPSIQQGLAAIQLAVDPVYPTDVRNYGAVGDGTTDDSVAFQNAVDAAAQTGGTVYVPAGFYLITRTITIKYSNAPVSLRGESWGAVILWSSDADLFVWQQPAGHVMVDNIAIASINTVKSKNSTAIKFAQGITQSVLSSLLFYGQGSIPGSTYTATLTGTDLDLGPLTDTVTMRDCVHWFLGGTGVIIGRGSEVRIIGGRVIGQGTRKDGSIGIHVTGNNGGVHVVETDIIGLATGMLLDASNGQGSNREIFITHATFDSDGIGLHIADDSYVSISGCWAASSDIHNILIDEQSVGAILVVSGGTIFNGGVYGHINCSTGCNGLTALAGTFSITGTAIRNNQGRGVWVPNDNVANYLITGCRIDENGQGVNLSGSAYSVTSNIFAGNNLRNTFGAGSNGSVITNNVNP